MKRKRNPMARELLTNKLFRPKQAKTIEDRTKQRDGWNRRAKHKSPRSHPGLGDPLSKPPMPAPSSARQSRFGGLT